MANSIYAEQDVTTRVACARVSLATVVAFSPIVHTTTTEIKTLMKTEAFGDLFKSGAF